MSYLKNSSWMLPIMAGVAMLWVVSACANWYFGLSLGNDDPFRMLFFTTTTAELFSHASLASDLIKSAALFAVFAAIANRQALAAIALFMAFLCCTAWSIASAVGFVSLNYSSMTDNRGKTAVEWTQLENQIARLDERRQQVAAARPVNVVQAEIDGIMRTPGVNGCTAIDGPVTRALCPQLDTLKVELANAEAGPWLDGRLAELRSELKGTPRVTSEDPRADMYARITGKVSEDMAVWLALFFAFMIELLTATGFWAAWTAFGAASGRKQLAESPQKDAESLQKAPEASPAPDTPPEAKAPVEDAPEQPDEPSAAEKTPRLAVDNSPRADMVLDDELTTVVNFPKPVSKREKARQKKEKKDQENRALVEAYVDDRLDLASSRAQIVLSPKGGHRTGGTEGDAIYQDFRRYCKEHGATAVGRNHLGRFIGEFVDRARNSKGVVYGAVIRSEQKRKVA